MSNSKKVEVHGDPLSHLNQLVASDTRTSTYGGVNSNHQAVDSIMHILDYHTGTGGSRNGSRSLLQMVVVKLVRLAHAIGSRKDPHLDNYVDGMNYFRFLYLHEKAAHDLEAMSKSNVPKPTTVSKLMAAEDPNYDGDPLIKGGE